MEKDSQGAIIELYELYAELDAAERADANEALLEALREGDEDKRFDALAIIDEFSLREAIPDLRALSARLQFDFNHFAQDRHFNNGAYRNLESSWKKQLDAGKDVYVLIKPHYPEGSLRPSSIEVTWTIDGKTGYMEFPNPNQAK